MGVVAGGDNDCVDVGVGQRGRGLGRGLAEAILP